MLSNYFVIGLLLFPTYLFAAITTQTPLISSNQSRNFHQVTVDDGLSQGLVLFIHQDRKGFLWFGTAGGLDRYDGVEFKHFRKIHGLDKQPVYFYSCLESQDSTFWLGTDVGLLRFNPITNEAEVVSIGEITERVGTLTITHLTQISAGVIIFGVEGVGLVRYDVKLKKTSVIHSVPPSISDHNFLSIKGIIHLKGNKYLVLTDTHLFSYDDDTKSTEQIVTFPHDHSANCMWLDRTKEIVWIGTSKGLFTFAQNIMSPPLIPIRGVLAQQKLSVESIHCDKRGRLWIGTSNGLAAFDPAQNEVVFFHNNPADPFSIASGPVIALAEDFTENLWISIHDAGVARLNLKENKFNMITNRAGFPEQLLNTIVSSLLVEPDGNFWVAGGGLHYVDRKKGNITRFSSVLPSPASTVGERTMRLRRVSDSFFLIHTLGHLYEYDVRENKVIKLQIDGKVFSNVRQVHIRENSMSAIIFLADGIVEVDLMRKRKVATLVSFADGTTFPQAGVCTSIIEDGQGTIWFGTNSGLFAYNKENNTFFLFLTLSAGDIIDPKQPVLSMALSKQGILWVGTDTGLRRIDLRTQTTRSYTSADGLPNDKIWSTSIDNSNSVWIGTNRGLVRLREGNRAQLDIRIFTTEDGLPSNEFNMGVTGMDADGNLYMGTGKGVVYWSPNSLFENSYIPPVVLTGITLFGVPMLFSGDIAYLNDISLSYEKKVLTFTFSALEYTDPKRNNYSYKLIGYDQAWNDIGTRREAYYNNLDPGEYVFRVRASNNDGVWNEEGLSIKIKIIPPFWKTWWFNTAFLIFIGAAIGGSIRYVEKKKLLRNLEKLEREHALERERIRISKDMHDEVGASLTKIAILSELTKTEINNSKAVENNLEKISNTSREVINNISEIIWALNPKHDRLDNLVAYVREHASEYLEGTSIKLIYDVPDSIPAYSLSTEKRRNIYLVIKEIIHNAVKHSCATELKIKTRFENSMLMIDIDDNGKGFDCSTPCQFSNGIINMRKRMNDICGNIEFQSCIGFGTKISITVSLDYPPS